MQVFPAALVLSSLLLHWQVSFDKEGASGEAKEAP